MRREGDTTTEIPTSEQTDRTTAPTDSLTTNLGGPQTAVALRPFESVGLQCGKGAEHEGGRREGGEEVARPFSSYSTFLISAPSVSGAIE